MMQVIMRLSREKRVEDDTDFVNATTRVRGVIEGPSYPLPSLVVSKMGVLPYPVLPLANVIP